METLPDIGGVRFLRNFPLDRISFVGTKGRTLLLARPEGVEALINLMNWIACEGYVYFVSGLCSNTLFGDGFFNGIVVDTRCISGIEVRGERVKCLCGTKLSQLVDACVHAGLSGLEELAGIPGTVGGAVVMNAGAFGRSIGDLVEQVECWVDGERVCLKGNEVEFDYRTSSLKHCIVMSATFKLSLSKWNLKKRVNDVIIARKSKFPQGRTLGSVFKNPFPFYAGKVIEEVGLKGYSMGQVKVSERHANFIVSERGAKAGDYVRLVSLIKECVLNNKGILLAEEIVYAGSFQ